MRAVAHTDTQTRVTRHLRFVHAINRTICNCSGAGRALSASLQPGPDPECLLSWKVLREGGHRHEFAVLIHIHHCEAPAVGIKARDRSGIVAM